MATKPQQELDPDRFRCVYEIVGQRCANVGTWSPSGSGRWYCSDHRQFDGAHVTQRSGPPGGFESLKEIVAGRQTADAWEPGRE